MRRIVIFLLLIGFTSATRAQDITFEDLVQYLTTTELAEIENFNARIDELNQMSQTAMNINTASSEDLSRIPFLEERAITEILLYIERTGGMRTLGELIYISNLDYDARRFLPLFFYAERIKEDTHIDKPLRFSSAHHILQTKIDIPFYERAGYSAKNTDQRYQGSSIANMLRYQFNMNNQITAAIIADKDQGEPVGKPFTMGYDHWSGFAMVKNMGIVKTAVIGDYRIGFGEGLLLNQQFSVGKIMQSAYHARGITGKSSASETNFMRGAAVTLGLCKEWSLSGFFSYRLMDGTLHQGTTMVSSLSTVTTHRNRNEIEKRFNTSEFLYGGNIQWNGRHFNIGVTGFSERFHLPFWRGTEIYREYYPEGDSFWGISVNYGMTYDRLSLSGETSTDGHGIATLNRVGYRFPHRIMTMVAHRYYSPRYHSFHSSALSEWGVQNEHGIFTSVTAPVTSSLTLTASADYFKAPHERYQINHPTNGFEMRLRADYDINRRNSLMVRAGWKNKEAYNIRYITHNYQTTWRLSLSEFTLRTQAMYKYYGAADGSRSHGFALQHHMDYANSSGKFRAGVIATWFHTKDYDSRIYASQLALLNNYNSIMLYGHGLRFAASARYTWCQYLTLMARYSVLRYFDREMISSGLQLINSPWCNDLSIGLTIRI